MAEGLRHIQADVSDSTLSTAGGLGLEVCTFYSVTYVLQHNALQYPCRSFVTGEVASLYEESARTPGVLYVDG